MGGIVGGEFGDDVNDELGNRERDSVGETMVGIFAGEWIGDPVSHNPVGCNVWGATIGIEMVCERVGGGVFVGVNVAIVMGVNVGENVVNLDGKSVG